MRTPRYVNVQQTSTDDDTYCMTWLGMQDVRHYLLMCVYGTCYTHILTERYYFHLGFAVISLTCSECISPSSRYKRAPHAIRPGFFVLRTYALWSNNRIVLVAMLSTFFVSLVLSPHPSL